MSVSITQPNNWLHTLEYLKLRTIYLAPLEKFTVEILGLMMFYESVFLGFFFFGGGGGEPQWFKMPDLVC